jgi:hypothetical protein
MKKLSSIIRDELPHYMLLGKYIKESIDHEVTYDTVDIISFEISDKVWRMTEDSIEWDLVERMKEVMP